MFWCRQWTVCKENISVTLQEHSHKHLELNYVCSYVFNGLTLVSVSSITKWIPVLQYHCDSHYQNLYTVLQCSSHWKGLPRDAYTSYFMEPDILSPLNLIIRIAWSILFMFLVYGIKCGGNVLSCPDYEWWIGNMCSHFSMCPQLKKLQISSTRIWHLSDQVGYISTDTFIHEVCFCNIKCSLRSCSKSPDWETDSC
jgi:hypothetical protein